MELQWQYFWSPGDAFSLNIAKRCKFVIPWPVHVRRRIGKKGTQSQGLTDEVKLCVGSLGVFWPCDDLRNEETEDEEGMRATMGEVLERAGFHMDEHGTIPTLLVVKPICLLLFHGAWQSLLYLARWPQPWPWAHFPPRAWVTEVAGTEWSADGSPSLNTEGLQRLASDLRDWAPLIVAAGPDRAEKRREEKRQ